MIYTIEKDCAFQTFGNILYQNNFVLKIIVKKLSDNSLWCDGTLFFSIIFLIYNRFQKVTKTPSNSAWKPTRIDIMKKMSLQSIARSYDRAVSNPNPEAFVHHMCTVFREDPARWSNAVDKFSKHGK